MVAINYKSKHSSGQNLAAPEYRTTPTYNKIKAHKFTIIKILIIRLSFIILDNLNRFLETYKIHIYIFSKCGKDTTISTPIVATTVVLLDENNGKSTCGKKIPKSKKLS